MTPTEAQKLQSRLRWIAEWLHGRGAASSGTIAAEAADEIERLRDIIERARRRTPHWVETEPVHDILNEVQ